MKFRHPRLCLILFGIALNASLAADYQTGVQAYQQGDYGRALDEWQRVIESPPADVHPGERAETFYAVAMLFWLGQGVPQDTATAAGFLRQAAELNHAGAQSKLGYLYLIGQGVPASDFDARKWLEMGARQGDVDAQYNLAVIYRDGIGTAADHEKAIQWFEEAAANGDPVSADVMTEYRRQGHLQTAAAPSAEPQPETDLALPQNEPAFVQDGITPFQTPSVPESAEPQGDLPPAHNEDWVLAQDKTHYTIQVIALKNAQSMNQLVAMHPEMQPFAIYLQGSLNQPLYVLVQGNYTTLTDAQAAQQRFPASLAKPDQLWIRRFGMVQDLIYKRQDESRNSLNGNHGTH